jgi:hypothetical protein
MVQARVGRIMTELGVTTRRGLPAAMTGYAGKPEPIARHA